MAPTSTPLPALPPAVERWELAGGTWRVAEATGARAIIELLRCDGGEVVDRVTLTREPDLDWARRHSARGGAEHEGVDA